MSNSDQKSFLFSKNPLLWTGWYFVASYLIFLLIFNFNILHASNWARLPYISLRGFSGLAFGVALFAWIPVWVAGLLAIRRTGKPLFGSPKSSANKEKAEEFKTFQEPEPKIEFPKNLPEEMRVPYSRMIRGQLSRGAMDCKVVQNTGKPAAALSAECTPTNVDGLSADPMTGMNGEMALPESFDFDSSPGGADANAPVFREISFGDPSPDSAYASDIKIETRGDKKFAIATHDDPDFWIADSDNWFATGKQKPSPVAAVIAAAKENDASPVLHLAAENIMDLDSQKEKWQSEGVMVIKDLSEI